MTSDSGEMGSASAGVSRRQILAGSGLAAAAWAAPSVVRLDVASAAGSGLAPSFISITPNSTLDPCVELTRDDGSPVSTSQTTGIPGPTGTTSIGPFGNNTNDLGQLLRTTVDGAPAHSSVTITVEICYRDWENSGTPNPANIDYMDILLDGTSLFGGQIIPGDLAVIDEMCIVYAFPPVAHSSGMLDLDILGGASASADDFGVARIEITFN